MGESSTDKDDIYFSDGLDGIVLGGDIADACSIKLFLGFFFIPT